MKITLQTGKGNNHLVPILIPEDAVGANRKLSESDVFSLSNVSQHNSCFLPWTRLIHTSVAGMLSVGCAAMHKRSIRSISLQLWQSRYFTCHYWIRCCAVHWQSRQPSCCYGIRCFVKRIRCFIEHWQSRFVIWCAVRCCARNPVCWYVNSADSWFTVWWGYISPNVTGSWCTSSIKIICFI